MLQRLKIAAIEKNISRGGGGRIYESSSCNVAITLPRVFPKNFLISPRSMAEELARDGGHELNTEFQYTSWINPTFLSDQPFLPPPFIYPAAFESIVAVSICPVILAVYHDYTGGRTGSIHRHRPSAIQVHVSGAQSFMHAVSKAVVHSTLSLSSSVSSPNFSYLVDALPTHPPARYFPLLDSIPRG